jgi:hypothetical protein
MQLLQPLRQRRVRERANERLRKLAVKRKVVLRHADGGGETPLIRRIIAAKRADVVQGPRFAPHHPLSGRKLRIGGILRLALEHRLVEAGRQRIDQIDVTGKFVVLFLGHASGNEDAQMADVLVNRIHDRLSV